jgi:predicted MFS family arabinose efflux permease
LNRLDDFLGYRQIALIGSLGMGTSVGGLAFTTQSLSISLGLLGVMGVCAGLVGIPMQTTIQEQTPEEMRGKVFGLQNNLVNIALSLPLALAGVAEAFFGIEPVLLVLAGLVMTGGLLTWYISDTANR